MERISRFVIIAAPPQTVFDIVADYRTLPQIQPQFNSVRPLGDLDYGFGAKLEAQGSLHGLPLAATMLIVEFDPPNLMVSDSTGAVNSRSIWRFTPVAGEDGEEKTRAALAVEYEFANIAFSLIRPIVYRELEGMTEQSLRRLKRLVEGK